MSPSDLPRQLWLNPATAGELSLPEWDTVIHHCRKSNLLAELYHRLNDYGCLDKVPDAPSQHLHSAKAHADKHRLDTKQELRYIAEALAKRNLTTLNPILLKGAAYVAKDKPLSRGRIFNDIDILVPRESIADVESALLTSGWRMNEPSTYNQKYYRTWMHQIPPLVHISRGTNIDVHHTILPLTSRATLEANDLINRSVPLSGEFANFRTLDPVDMLLHSATHLFHEGEFDFGLRDLIDLNHLLNECDKLVKNFSSEVIERAKELDLEDSLYYAVALNSELLDNHVAKRVLVTWKDHPGNGWLKPSMNKAFTIALRPRHYTTDTLVAKFVRILLYIRGHYLRMKLHLLIPHLARKAALKT